MRLSLVRTRFDAARLCRPRYLGGESKEKDDECQNIRSRHYKWALERRNRPAIKPEPKGERRPNNTRREPKSAILPIKLRIAQATPGAREDFHEDQWPDTNENRRDGAHSEEFHSISSCPSWVPPCYASLPACRDSNSQTSDQCLRLRLPARWKRCVPRAHAGSDAYPGRTLDAVGAQRRVAP